jgi:hypothetical protein
VVPIEHIIAEMAKLVNEYPLLNYIRALILSRAGEVKHLGLSKIATIAFVECVPSTPSRPSKLSTRRSPWTSRARLGLMKTVREFDVGAIIYSPTDRYVS